MSVPDASAQTPEWWLNKLYERLVERRAEIDFYDAYYRGDHPLPWLAPQARDEFRRILQMTRSNYMGLVVDSMVERMQLQGFRMGPAQESADAATWRIWQANNLDSDFDQGLLEAAVGGRSYLHVAPNAKDAATPHLWVEHASQVILAFEPGTNRRVRVAALKVYTDEWTGEIHATLQALGRLFKYKAPAPKGTPAATTQWERREVRGEVWGAPNPLGVVSIVELPNNPRLLTGGVSELADLTDIQDRVNKTLADRLMTQDYGAFPQKWATGWPEEDESGNPLPSIEIGRNRMVTTDVKETQFGQWQSAPLDPYSASKREDVKDIASRSRTPAQYLLGEMSNVNGETLKASESGLVSKVRQRMRKIDDPVEEAIRIVRRAAGLPNAGAESIETIWRDPQYRTEAEMTDATVKKLQSGIISLRQAREDLGYSAAQIARLEEHDATAATDPTMERVVSGLLNAPSGASA